MTNAFFGASPRAALGACSVLLLTLAFAPLGCKHKKGVGQPAGEAPGPGLHRSHGRPQTATQLIAGFYGIEQNAWRWTGQRFSLMLRPPLGASQKGGTLRLRLTCRP